MAAIQPMDPHAEQGRDILFREIHQNHNKVKEAIQKWRDGREAFAQGAQEADGLVFDRKALAWKVDPANAVDKTPAIIERHRRFHFINSLLRDLKGIVPNAEEKLAIGAFIQHKLLKHSPYQEPFMLLGDKEDRFEAARNRVDKFLDKLDKQTFKGSVRKARADQAKKGRDILFRETQQNPGRVQQAVKTWRDGQTEFAQEAQDVKGKYYNVEQLKWKPRVNPPFDDESRYGYTAWEVEHKRRCHFIGTLLRDLKGIVPNEDEQDAVVTYLECKLTEHSPYHNSLMLEGDAENCFDDATKGINPFLDKLNRGEKL